MRRNRVVEHRSACGPAVAKTLPREGFLGGCPSGQIGQTADDQDEELNSPRTAGVVFVPSRGEVSS